MPAAIQFQADHDWPAVRAACRALLDQALARIAEVTGQEPLYPPGSGFYQQMAVAALPPIADLRAFKKRLLKEYRIQIPCIQWGDRQFIRLSLQAYNTPEEVEALVEALGRLL